MGIFLNIHYSYLSQIFFFWFGRNNIIFENFNNFENNIIGVELAEGLGYYYSSISTFPPSFPPSTFWKLYT